MLHICFAFTDENGSYHKNVLTALTSVFENTAAAVRAHLICDASVPEAHKERFFELARRYKQEILFHAAPEIPQATLDNVRACFGKGSLFRLFMPELIEADQALYLDCDTICNLDIREVFALCGPDCPAAGVADAGLRDDPRSAARLRKDSMDPERYINSGVMLLNLARLRAEHPDFRAWTLGAIAGKKFLYMDQDAINLYFQTQGIEVRLLPDRYNLVLGIKDRAYQKGAYYRNSILHYTRDKPWQALYPAALSYWKYYARCFSADEAFERMGALRLHEHSHLYAFLLRRPDVRRMLNRVHDVAAQGLWESILDRLLPARRKEKRRAAQESG